MGKRQRQGSSRTRAIQNALARLGMQASLEQVVAIVAGFGSGVTEAPVRQVKVQMLTSVAGAAVSPL